MLLPVAQEKQQESWLYSIGQMQSMQEAVNASKPIACNKPKYSIIVVSAALLARDFQGCTLQECMGEFATDGAMETEVQRRRTAVQQAFQGMLGCLAGNGRILVHMDPTLDDPMERQERRIAEATSALACYSGQLLFSCRPDEAMHYATECIRSSKGHKSRQSHSCVDQRITRSMENHARIVVVGHKDAIWKTKLQPCECTSPQGEHGSTRVSWQEQLRATDPVDAKEVLASLQTRGDSVFTGLAAYQWAVVLNDAAVWEHLEQEPMLAQGDRPTLWLVGEGSGNVVQATMSVLPEEFDVHCYVPDKHWFHVQHRFLRYLGHRQSSDVVDTMVRLGH